jgi:cobyrinic acid a,c-diamide synthase
VVAECAGLLWLCRALDGAPMCGVLAADATMTPTLTLGYRDAVALTDSPLAVAGTRITGHEFHRTVTLPRSGLLLSPAGAAAWAWRGADPEGFVAGAVHASFLHLHWAARPGVARRLVAAAGAGRSQPMARPLS